MGVLSDCRIPKEDKGVFINSLEKKKSKTHFYKRPCLVAWGSYLLWESSMNFVREKPDMGCSVAWES